MFVRQDLIDVREKFIIYLSCCCPPSFVSSLWRKVDDFMVGSKHRTCWNWKFLSVKIRMQRVEQELNVQRTRIFWIELLDAAANHRWQQLTSRQKWCRVHLTFSSTAPEWVCTDLSLPSAGWNCISGVHSHCSCSAECMCIFIFIRSSSCIRQKALWTVQSTVGI